ncbi:MAG: ArsC family reductase [Methylovulum sp.]|nr:ArsC family reductase [Methylovulum sp.]
MYTLYGIKNCDTVKKARKYLDERGLPYQFHDFRADGFTFELLEHFDACLGWDALLNRSSTSWRQLASEQRASITRTTALQLMLDIPTLIKRPVLDTGDQLIIGFKADSYKQL